MKVDGAELVRATAIPFNEPAVIAEARDGERRLYREVFDRNSFTSVPDRIPFVRAHQRNNPLGWSKLKLTNKALLAEVHLVDTAGARDALTEIKARLMTAVSIGFIGDESKDEVSRAPGSLPSVRRRGVELLELSLVSRGAYPGAVVTEITRTSWQSQESEAIMKPWREERAKAAAVRRAENALLMSDVLTLGKRGPVARDGTPIVLRAPVPVQQAEAGPVSVVDLGSGAQVTVAAEGYEAERLAHAYLSDVVMALREKGESLSRQEMDELQSRHRVLA